MTAIRILSALDRPKTGAAADAAVMKKRRRVVAELSPFNIHSSVVVGTAVNQS
jgi:hypothetical protein